MGMLAEFLVLYRSQYPSWIYRARIRSTCGWENKYQSGNDYKTLKNIYKFNIDEIKLLTRLFRNNSLKRNYSLLNDFRQIRIILTKNVEYSQLLTKSNKYLLHNKYLMNFIRVTKNRLITNNYALTNNY